MDFSLLELAYLYNGIRPLTPWVLMSKPPSTNP